MAEPILCVSWNGHVNELARGRKTFLENNSFVDCTIAAEGKSLKAHRLILSSCSPYFQMLFNDENEKHTIVVLKDTSFLTLKTVIDFVYNGEVEIAAGQLETFLELAVSLQIKGLNKFLHEDRTINVLGNAAVETNQCSSRVNQDNSRDENSWTSHEDSVSNSSQQCDFHSSQNITDSTLEVPPVLIEGCGDSAEGVQSRPVMMPLQNHDSRNESDPLQCNPEVLVNTEQSLKQRSFSEKKSLETRSKVLENDNQVESISGYHEEEMNDAFASAFEENVDRYSSDKESLHSNGNSALVVPKKQQQQQQELQEKELHWQEQQQQQPQHLEQHLQQQQVDQQQLQLQEQQQEQHVSHSACQLSSPPDLTERNHQLLPELSSMPLSNEADDSESEESTNALDVPGNDTEEMAEETELAHEESLNPSSGAEGSPTPQDEDQEQDRGQTMPEGSANSVPRPTVPSAPKLQAHVRLIRMPTLKCRDCDAIFASSRALEDHKRQHSGTQPLRRGVCGASSTATSDLAPPTLDAERQCSKALALHKQRHKVERPHPCDVCGKAFTTAGAVALHQRRHKRERERTQPRDVSRKALVKADTHALHKRGHTRKGPHSCNVCGKVFTAQSHLIIHTRIHTGERPYVCSVCGKAFNQTSALTKHKRTHMGESPYSCDVCGKAFTTPGDLAQHKRRHTGQQPICCDACPRRFSSKSSMISHWQRIHVTK
ncbi:hypothetical protein R5R35_010458 [Gryllus longicercus]|uniref:Uncharacterized protein n=1 Tax=Gryllus longicercus TaxID=2509291 RepID=A0AAN9ZEC3_9ORTH